MEASDYISLSALVVSLSVAAFSVYQYISNRRANLKFKMSIGRSYLAEEISHENGLKSMIATEEKNPLRGF